MLIASGVSSFLCSVQCLFSQHGLPFTAFFLFLTSPNSYRIATTLDLRKTEKTVKTFRSNPVQKTQLNKKKDESKAERLGKKVQHNTGAGRDSDTEREYNSYELKKTSYFQK